MKNLPLLFTLLFFSQCSGPKSDSWETFKSCASNDCVKEAIVVKDDFLKDPEKLLSQFQTTYENGEDHVLGWLFILRDSVLINPKMGTQAERLALQKKLLETASLFLNNTKVHEMAESVINELQIADIKTGIINDPTITATVNCFQFTFHGDTTSCRISLGTNGVVSGYYAWLPDGKDGTMGILKGKLSGDTLIVDHRFLQEGEYFTESLIFLKKEYNLVQLVSENFDQQGRMILINLRPGDVLIDTDCNRLEALVKYIDEEKLSF